VHQAVKSLREALGKEGGHFLKIVRGQGYRIDAEIKLLEKPALQLDTSPLISGETRDQTADTPQLTRGGQITRISPRSPEEIMAFLLFIDQFPVGIWGASLESAADLWGHKNDPGSITISTRACIGLTGTTGSVSLPPITAYRMYLGLRRSGSGAFGMLRDPGSSWMPNPDVQEHARHTATALQFFHYYDGVEHPFVIGAVEYLLRPDTRTVSGYWADKVEKSDVAADPVTVAFVVGALEEVYRAASDAHTGKEAALPATSGINEAIQVGLHYIHSTKLRTSEGMWHYKFSNELSRKRVMDNLYQYTADVLAQTGPSCTRLNMYLEESKAIAHRLKRISNGYKGGLPQSPSQNTPHLDTTATLIEALWQLQEPLESLEAQFLSAYELARRRDVCELSTASGWSSFLMLSRRPFGEKLRISVARAEELLSAGNELALKVGAAGSIPPLPEASEEFIRGLLKRRQARQPG
jgi:hypothetical protein